MYDKTGEGKVFWKGEIVDVAEIVSVPDGLFLCGIIALLGVGIRNRCGGFDSGSNSCFEDRDVVSPLKLKG